jgi:hypothetical protein
MCKARLSPETMTTQDHTKASTRPFVLIVVVLSWLSGCAFFQGGISYYDPTTFKSLTDLKPEIVMLYETFAGDTVNTEWIRSVRLRLAQMYEYEKGKGEKNKETTEQIAIIRKMVNGHVDERIQGARWSETHMMNQIENIQEAFDIAIRTERLKNKNE